MVQGVLCALTGRAAFLFRGNVETFVGASWFDVPWAEHSAAVVCGSPFSVVSANTT